MQYIPPSLPLPSAGASCISGHATPTHAAAPERGPVRSAKRTRARAARRTHGTVCRRASLQACNRRVMLSSFQLTPLAAQFNCSNAVRASAAHVQTKVAKSTPQLGGKRHLESTPLNARSEERSRSAVTEGGASDGIPLGPAWPDVRHKLVRYTAAAPLLVSGTDSPSIPDQRPRHCCISP